MKIPYENFYENVYLRTAKDMPYEKTKRGYILGMANFIFTLVQIGIFEMAGRKKYIVGNDDALVIIPKEEG